MGFGWGVDGAITGKVALLEPERKIYSNINFLIS